MTSMANANWVTMAVGFTISILIGVLFILKPIQFWKKFAGVFGYADHIRYKNSKFRSDMFYSMILPSILFHFSFTCVRSPISRGALAVPPAASWYSYLVGCTLAGLAVVSLTLEQYSTVY
jgi:hypothetical protein